MQSGKKKDFFILSSEWLPHTSMNAAASRLKRSGKSFKIFLSYFRKPLLPRIARKKRFRKLYSNRKQKRFFCSKSRVASAHQYECSSQQAEKERKKFLNFSKLFPEATGAPAQPGKSGSGSSIQTGKQKEFFILSSEWLPHTSMNAAASRLKRSGKSF